LFYRGALDDAEVFSPAGKLVFLEQSEIQGRIDDAITASSLGDILHLGSGDLHLCLISKDGTNVREVFGLFGQGVSTLPLDHAWFNRTP
jgi:hypothetical protein